MWKYKTGTGGRKGRFGVPGPTRDKNGAVLILVLLVLALVTVMGVYAATRSTLEEKISSNTRNNLTVFYAAEGGLNHALAILKTQFSNGNQNNISTTGTTDWNFLIGAAPLSDGSVLYPTAATQYYCQGIDTGASCIDGAWTTGGVQIFQRSYTLNNVTLTNTVTAFNNNETSKTGTQACSQNTCAGTASATSDCDGTVMLRSTAVATVGSTTVAENIQETSINGCVSNALGILSGLSQEYANEGKTSSAIDVNDITTSDLGNVTTF